MILVTGGAGFIGSNIVADLTEKGHRVAVCDHFGTNDKWRNLAKHPIHALVDLDHLDDWLNEREDDIAHIIHMGAVSTTTEADVDLILRNNFTLSSRLWEFCGERRIPFLYASSAATYGDREAGFTDDETQDGLSHLRPLNPYGWSKHLFDRRVARDVAEGRVTPPIWAGLKFFNVYGPNEYHKGDQRSVVHQLFEQIRDTGTARLFKSHRDGIADGGQRRDFIHVDDCVSAIAWLMKARISGLFNLGTGTSRSFLDLSHAVFAAMGRPPKIEFVPTPETLRPRYQYFTEARMEKLRGCGFSAEMKSLEAGVRDYVQSYLMTDDPYR